MNVYTYIADSNPHAAKAICNSLGYKVANARTSADLGECLRQIVVNEGEDGFRKIMEYHPDKDVLMELFGKKDTESGSDNWVRHEQNALGRYHEQYMNFDGIAQSKSAAMQTNTFIIAAALMLAVAVIVKK